MHRVQELVRREARNLGFSITHAELIGLTPQQALIDSAKWYLQIKDLEDDQLLEQRIVAAEQADDRLESKLPEPFLTAVSDATPAPGGGSVGALAGALGAALVEMVAGLTTGRKKYADVDEKARGILDRARRLRYELTSAIARDAAAFEALFAVFRDKELDEGARQEAIESATISAGDIPLQVVRLSKDVAELALEIVEIGNTNAATDAASAGIMAQAAARVAGLNVQVNASGLSNREKAASWLEEVAALQESIDGVVGDLERVAAQRGGY